MSSALTMSEQQLCDATIQLAQLFGWKIIHLRPARTEDGWRTAIQGDGRGWPDLFCVRGHRALAAELKSDRGKVTPEQQQWLNSLTIADVESYVWRPVDWTNGTIEAVLRSTSDPLLGISE